jgi:Uncharacterised protein family
MLYLLKLFTFLINIDQETVLNWFGLEDPRNQEIGQTIQNGYNVDLVNLEPSPNVSFTTFRLIIEGLWEKVQDGLTLADIENVLFFILFIRFLILALRYNLKTSFYITCIGLFAGYLWYRHLIDLISMYRSVLLKLPFLNKLGMDAVQLRSLHRQMVLTDLKLGENTHWYNPGQILYYAFTKGIVHVDLETGLRYYIDPISMFISNLEEPTKSNVLPIYYKVYNQFIPKIFTICSKFWTQLSGVAAYAVITRIGKRYCPYLIRWHWTFLLITGIIEQIFIYFIYRVYYFQTFVLIPQSESYNNYVDPNLILQINILNGIIACLVLAHIGFIIFGLFHAIWGQYFYLPFFVENTELHIGPRPKNSLYSGGQTSWQDPEEKKKNLNRFFPKLWYGWFGRGTRGSWSFDNILKKFVKKIMKKLRKQFRR